MIQKASKWTAPASSPPKPGYLDEQSSIADFLDAIERELRGQPVFAQQQHNAEAIEQSQQLEQLAEYLKSRDVDVKTATNEQIKQLLQGAAGADVDPMTGEVLEQGSESLGTVTGDELGPAPISRICGSGPGNSISGIFATAWGP